MSPHAKFRANIPNSKLKFITTATFGHIAYFLLQLATLLQNFIILTQTTAELVVSVQKSEMAATILNYYFVTPDHPRSPFAVTCPSNFALIEFIL